MAAFSNAVHGFPTLFLAPIPEQEGRQGMRRTSDPDGSVLVLIQGAWHRLILPADLALSRIIAFPPPSTYRWQCSLDLPAFALDDACADPTAAHGRVRK